MSEMIPKEHVLTTIDHRDLGRLPLCRTEAGWPVPPVVTRPDQMPHAG